MYACQNCGASLKFDIPSQQLKCDACDSLFNPYDVTKEQDAIADEYEVNMFICPQCGGAILSDDNSIADFCSYCGGATVLTGRLTREKKPQKIIPFAKTRQDCREHYRDYMKRAIYAPKALKNPEKIEAFRGIYIPYWRYLFHRDQNIRMSGKLKADSGEAGVYSAQMQGETRGVAFDASSSFDDRVNEKIGSFDPAEAKEFTPSFLCGFYGDTADVPSEVYQEAALEADDHLVREILAREKTAVEHGVAQEDIPIKQFLCGECEEEVESMLCPVWFLSYRMGERVAYATVNGQTGKITADLPVDYRKFAAGCGGIALLVFGILNLFFTLRPEMAMVISCALLAVGTYLYSVEMRELFCRAYHVDDPGYLFGKKINAEKRLHYEKQKEKYEDIEVIGLGEFLVELLVGALVIAAEASGVIAGIVYGLCLFFGKFGSNLLPLWCVAAVVNGIYIINSFRFIKIMDEPDYKGVIGAIAALVISGLVLVINPVSDLYFYIAVCATLLAVLFLCVSLIGKYNELSTHVIPQFETNRGGDGHAN